MIIVGYDPGVLTGIAIGKVYSAEKICTLQGYANLYFDQLSLPDLVKDEIVIEQFSIRTTDRSEAIHKTIEAQGVIRYLAMKQGITVIMQQPFVKKHFKMRFPEEYKRLRAKMSGIHAEDHWADAAMHIMDRAAMHYGVREFII